MIQKKRLSTWSQELIVNLEDVLLQKVDSEITFRMLITVLSSLVQTYFDKIEPQSNLVMH